MAEDVGVGVDHDEPASFQRSGLPVVGGLVVVGGLLM